MQGRDEVTERPKFRKGQLKKDGRLGKSETFDFIPAKVIIGRLESTGDDMKLTIGLSFRNPRTNDKHYSNADAIAFLKEFEHSYTYEAYYNGDGYLHVVALSDNDLY